MPPKGHIREGYVRIHELHRIRLKIQMAEKQVGARALAGFMAQAGLLPEGVDRKTMFQTIESWRTGNVKSADSVLWLAAKRGLKKIEERVSLDAGKRQARLTVIKETPGIDGATLRKVMIDPPENLSAQKIHSIFCCMVKKAPRSELAHIFKAARALDIPVSGPGSPFVEMKAEPAPR